MPEILNEIEVSSLCRSNHNLEIEFLDETHNIRSLVTSFCMNTRSSGRLTRIISSSSALNKSSTKDNNLFNRISIYSTLSIPLDSQIIKEPSRFQEKQPQIMILTRLDLNEGRRHSELYSSSSLLKINVCHGSNPS